MEFVWVPFLFLSLTCCAFSTGAEKCYEVKTISEEGCVKPIEIVGEEQVWFSRDCTPAHNLYRLDQGEIDVVGTTPDKIIHIDSDSKGTPYVVTYDIDRDEGAAYTMKDGALTSISDGLKILSATVDKKDDVYLPGPTGFYRYHDGETKLVETASAGTVLLFSDSNGRNFLHTDPDIFWELYEDGSGREIFRDQEVHKFIEYPEHSGYLAATDTGLYHVTDDAVTPLYNDSLVRDVQPMDDDSMYFTTLTGAYFMKDGKVTPVEGLQNLEKKTDFDVVKDGNDNVYFSTEQVHVLKKGESTPHLITGLPSNNPIMATYVDSYNNLVFIVNDNDVKQFYFLPANTLEAHLIDEIKGSRHSSHRVADIMYVGTEKGLFFFKPKDCQA